MQKENTTTKTTKTTAKALPKAIMNKPLQSETDKIIAQQKKTVEKYAGTIRKELQSMEKSFLKIGHALYMISTIYNSKSFKTIGYKDIYDFANKEFGIARGTCSDFIHIIEKFAKRDEKGNLLPELDERYKDYSSSKLSIMITMGEEELEEVKPDMTVKAIKAVKGKKTTSNTSKSEPEVGNDIIDDNDFEISNVVISFRTLEEYNASIDKLDELIVRCLKAGHKVSISETAQKVRTSEQ